MSTVGNCKFDPNELDVTAAMVRRNKLMPKCNFNLQTLPGVQGFIGANDVPGQNRLPLSLEGYELFSSGDIGFVGQALGLILADTYEHARYGQCLEDTYSFYMIGKLQKPSMCGTLTLSLQFWAFKMLCKRTKKSSRELSRKWQVTSTGKNNVCSKNEHEMIISVSFSHGTRQGNCHTGRVRHWIAVSLLHGNSVVHRETKWKRRGKTVAKFAKSTSGISTVWRFRIHSVHEFGARSSC